VSNMPGDIFLNFLIFELLEIVAIFAITILVEKLGRRRFLLICCSIGGLACFSAIIPTLLGANDWILRGLSFGGKMCISCAISGFYIMSPELFPTVLRSFGLGSCSMMSRIGGLASPYVADLNILVEGAWGPALPQVVFGAAGLVTTVMVFFLPETRRRSLPETVEDAVQFGRSSFDSKDVGLELKVDPPAHRKYATKNRRDDQQPLQSPVGDVKAGTK